MNTCEQSVAGALLHYVWHFGDGLTVDTMDEVIHHTYVSRGQYNVTVSVVESRHTSTNTTVVTIQVGSKILQCILHRLQVHLELCYV